MTVIVWDGKFLAADKLAEVGGSEFSVTKIFRVNDLLVGLAGDFPHALLIRDWLDAGATGVFPARLDPNCWGVALVVRTDRSVWRYEGPSPIRIEDAQYASGSGADAARAALECGADALRAVEIASRIDINCGRGVDWLEWRPS